MIFFLNEVMNNRQTDETKTTGGVAITDATAAGTIQFGEHVAIEFEAAAARTPQEVVDALNASEDCPYEAELDEESIVLTAPVAGEEHEIAVTGDLFGDVTPMTTVLVTSYEAEPNHEYRVFSDYAGDVYAISGGTRIWRGTLEAGQPHPVCTGANTTGFEVETPAGRYVKVHDPEAPKKHVPIPTEQGKFYQIYSDDAFRVLHNGMVLAQQVYFGGVSVFHAAYRTTTLEVAEDATFSVTECPPPDPNISNRSTVVFQHNIETMNL